MELEQRHRPKGIEPYGTCKVPGFAFGLHLLSVSIERRERPTFERDGIQHFEPALEWTFRATICQPGEQRRTGEIEWTMPHGSAREAIADALRERFDFEPGQLTRLLRW